MKLPIQKSPIQSSQYNITYDELQALEFEQLKVWIDGLRNELLEIWDTKSIPPSIGKTKSEIIKSFSKLNTYDVNKIWVEDENYPQYLGFIKNFTNVGSSVNQFFPNMLKTKINGKSMYDWFSDDYLILEFRRSMVRALRFDGMYSFSRYLDGDDFQSWLNGLDGTVGWWLEPLKTLQNGEKTKNLKLGMNDAVHLLKKGILNTYDFRNSVYFNGDDDTLGYKVRYYDKSQKIFPNIIQIFRLSLGQPPVNFPPLTARFIYEKFLSHIDQNQYVVYDMCSGFGGRLLGSLGSKLNIHYLGTDVNSNNFGCYESLGEFYNNKCDGRNTYEMFRVGCEVINKQKEFQKYKGELDMCFTSPPYFDRENYSDDINQSINQYPSYNEWLDGFLSPMIKICYDYLKSDRYMIVNIADIKVGNEFIPIEQNTIELALNNNFKYIGKIGMVMSRMIGLNPKDVKNNWFDETTMTDFKVEPILIFKKDE